MVDDIEFKIYLLFLLERCDFFSTCIYLNILLASVCINTGTTLNVFPAQNNKFLKATH